MVTIQLLFGHPACLAVTVGVAVFTSTLARPFFGFSIVCVPPAVTGTAGFWPGAWLLPDGVVHVRPVAVPLPCTLATTVSLPSPATSAVHSSWVPTSVHTGVPPLVKCAPPVCAAAIPANESDAAATKVRIMRRSSGASFALSSFYWWRL